MINYTPITESIQNYLKAIYVLGEQSSPVSTNALAARLGVAPASVTGMLQHLSVATPSLVIYHKRQGVQLTPDGKRAALEVIRHHRLLETYLVTKLGFTWDEVHAEAQRLQHAISEELERRIDAALGHPAYDPHGEPIPRADLSMPSDRSRPLSAMRPDQRASIARVQDTDSDLLVHLKSLGLIPGSSIVVKAYSPFDENLTLQVGEHGKTVTIGPAISSRIFVDIIPIQNPTKEQPS